MTATPRRVVLSLGSNLGDRMAMLQGAVDALGAAARVVAVSPVFETDPVGGPEQGDFLNAVVALQTSMSARELLDLCRQVEEQHQRVRTERWGPRTLDVDIVSVADERVDEVDLVVPHPRAAERAFVLQPWLAMEPDAVLPGAGRVADLVSSMDVSGVRPRHDLALHPPVARLS
ncbi:MAG: 2-amino-4-hydroxy-6-hydroxymethyldihydropteridine diphosphokinase [Actinomycetes bacterium]